MRRFRSHAGLNSAARVDEDEITIVKAEYLVRRMRGKSGSILALCDDNAYYIVKFVGNPSGGNALANEILGAQLVTKLFHYAPIFAFVEASSSLLRSAPIDWWDGRNDSLRPPAGLHFGTRFIGNPVDPFTSDFISRRRIPWIKNREDFLGMLILDIWANTQKPRQAVFNFDGSRFVAHFIDFGCMFGGRDGVFCDDDFAGFYFDIDVYGKNIDLGVVDSWIHKIRHDAIRVISMTFHQIPPNYYKPSYCHVRDTLLDRLDRLEDLVYPIIERFKE